MAPVTMKALLETGVHFGHRARKWNPKMKPFIFTERNGIHIIDLQQTLKAVKDAYEAVRDMTMGGGTLLFVGTKRQAQETIAAEATRCGMPYINERWLGGTLTNWRTIRQLIEHLFELEARRDRGEFELLTKREALLLLRQIDRLNIRLGGIRNMTRLPSMIFVVDVRREATAIREANILNIPVVAMVDTNCDPDLIDYVIPANDDAIRAIKLITKVMADAVLEGLALRKDMGEEAGEAIEPLYEREYEYAIRETVGEEEEISDERFLGQATLAKLKSGTLFEDEEQVEQEEFSDQEAVEEELADEDYYEVVEDESDLETDQEDI